MKYLFILITLTFGSIAHAQDLVVVHVDIELSIDLKNTSQRSVEQVWLGNTNELIKNDRRGSFVPNTNNNESFHCVEHYKNIQCFGEDIAVIARDGLISISGYINKNNPADVTIKVSLTRSGKPAQALTFSQDFTRHIKL